ncbi:Oidioi.mRNA.OKI2018_I69.chr2.g6755.t1.cds [Oikopleura dioica]|uniref:Oidioi.mRNA.OKI2018_I69.chr2.g6755.t1.cds n=1 Tax=Oikopleura dioica TaxID=34765 RepID=A0ABN7T501_OIKDI|nr:Oidioi.mRNA.OKI2018_I69.chr2.g6755.t1.cds [Oikopleura dioica]
MDLKNSRLKSCWRRQVLRRRFAEDVDLEKPVSSRLLDLRAARKARENNSSNVSTPDSGFGDEDYQRPTIEQSLSKPESDFEKTTTENKSSSPVTAPAVDIWKMIQERKPEHKTAKIENGKDNSEQLKGLEQENHRLRDELANTCPKSELNELRRKLEAAESEITDLKAHASRRPALKGLFYTF